MIGLADQNIGHIERVIRVGIGLSLVAIGGLTALPTWATMVLLVVGLVALVTGIMGFCPAWKLLGMNTCRQSHTH